jgi:hypothetical protein
MEELGLKTPPTPGETTLAFFMPIFHDECYGRSMPVEASLLSQKYAVRGLCPEIQIGINLLGGLCPPGQSAVVVQPTLHFLRRALSRKSKTVR